MRAILALCLTSCVYSSAATMACDWRTTRHSAQRGWSERYENNPFISESGGTPAVDVWFAVSAIAVVGLIPQLPERWQTVAHTLLTAAEIRVIYRWTQGTGGTVCGF